MRLSDPRGRVATLLDRAAACAGVPMRCPHCGSVVEPLRDTSGALFCPACQNTGRVIAAWPPQAPPPAPPSAQRPGPPPGAFQPPAWQPQAKPPGKLVASVALGISAIVLFPIGLILGTIAVICATKGRNELRRLPPGTPGEGMATAGLALGIVGIVVGVFGGLVLMSAVVFVLVSNLGEGSEGAPSVSFMKDEAGPGGRLTVVQADAEGHWQDFTASGDAGCILPFGPVRAGDVIECGSAGTVELLHRPTNSLVYATTFMD